MSATNLYLEMRKNHALQQGIMRLQENGRQVVRMLAQDIKSAGLLGCAKWEDLEFKNHVPELTGKIGSHLSVVGYHVNKNNQLPSAIANRVLPETDVITVTKAAGKPAYLTEPMQSNTAFKVNSSTEFAPGQLVLISDCKKADLIKVHSISSHNGHQLISTTSPIATTYGKEAQVSRFEAIAYFIGKSKAKNSVGHSVNALYRKDLYAAVHRPDSVIEGVDAMHIQYGVDALKAGHITDYLPADQVKYWERVIGIEIALLLNSVEPIFEKSRAFKFHGTTYISSDRRLYREWDTYIALRQRIQPRLH